MSVRSAAGTKISVTAAAPATFTEAGFTALTYSLIGEITDAGSTGRVYAKIEHSPLATRGKVKKKGSFDSGTQNIVIGLDRADAGQILLRAAADSDEDYYFKLEEQDGTIVYYAALVMGFPINRGTVDNIVNVAITLEVQQRGGIDFIEVEPDDD